MWRIARGLALIATALASGGCDATAAPALERSEIAATPQHDAGGDPDCAAVSCRRLRCAAGQLPVLRPGECCEQCEPAPVDAGAGCLCDPAREAVCGDDFQLYHNACFASCAGAMVLAEGSCPSRERFPEGNYGEACERDGDCDAPYACLPNPLGFGAARVCSVACESVEECPRVISDHCGDQTQCTDGVCGSWPCI